MGKIGWGSGLLVIFPLGFWMWAYAQSPVWWVENIASAPGGMVFFYSMLSCCFLFQRRWGWGVLAMALGGGFLSVTEPEQKILQSECTDSVKVLQYNVFFDNPYVNDFIEFVKHEQPDIMVLQEVSPQLGKQFDALHPLYPYRYGGQPKIGYPSNQLILSKQRLYGMSVFRTADGQHLIRGIWQPKLGIDVALMTAHLPSPRDERLWHRRNSMIQTIEYFSSRSAVARMLVVGDFNLSSNSVRYQQILPGFVSVPVNTWPHLPFSFQLPSFSRIGIDHLWIHGEAEICARYAVSQIKGSDHWPVITEIRFTSATI